jgi:hypothetical protein
MSTPTSVPVDDASPSTGLDASDPLAAFLDGLHGLSSRDGVSSSLPAGASGPPMTMLSNGLNADAGVVQVVSALAGRDPPGLHTTPFAAPSDPGIRGDAAGR